MAGVYCTGVVNFATRHACVTFWTHSWPATGKPRPTRLCKKCDIGAPECTSVHGIGIVVLNKWMKSATKTQSLLASTPWSHKSHMITLVAVHDFIFHLSMMSLTHFEDLATMKMAARATATHARDSKHQSNYRRTKPAADSQINMTVLYMHFKLLCGLLNSHQKLWYKSEKAFGLWSEWHFTTRGLVNGYI